MRGSCNIRSVEVGVKFWIFVFFLIQLKTVRFNRSTNHSYWALKLYLFWVKAPFIAWRCPKMQYSVAVFFQLKIKRKHRFKIQRKFQYLCQFQHFKCNMIRALLFQILFLIKPMLCNYNSTDCPLIATTPKNQWLPLVGPQFQNHVELRNTDGLMAFFISEYVRAHHMFSLIL